jgi:hypothetical protein
MSVLVCLALVMLLFAGWIRTVLLERRQLRAIEHRMQAEYLADSALRRAAAQLAANPAYAGETWKIEAPDFDGRAAASVAIQVQAVPDEARSRRVRAIADFPAEAAARVRRSKETKLVLSSRGETP